MEENLLHPMILEEGSIMVLLTPQSLVVARTSNMEYCKGRDTRYELFFLKSCVIFFFYAALLHSSFSAFNLL
jgi:hypothetical protein